MSSQSATASTAAWARLLAVLLSRAYRTSLLVLAAVAIAPLLFGWASFAIKSGSMEPSINVGDVVVARPFETGETIAVGRVYVFNDPAATQDHTLTHRIVERLDDGTFVSAGDANEVTDFTPVAVSDMEARGIILAPFVGLPVVWTQAGEWIKLALWLLLTIAAFALATRNLDGEPPKWNLLSLVLERRRPRSAKVTEEADENETEGPETVPAVRRSITPAVIGVVLAILATGMGTANAKFVSQTRNSNWSFAAGQLVQPYVSAVLTDQPYGFWLLDEGAGSVSGADRSGHNRTSQYYDSLTLGRPGGLVNNPGTAVRTSGGRVVLGPQAVSAPSAYSIELWFRTTSTSQSYLAGFEDDRDANYSLFGDNADRAVTMESNGRLTFGRWPWSGQSISTSRAYNDGAWHHLVVTSTASRATTIYVDGASVASGTTSTVASYTGFWRIGQGSIAFLNTPGFAGEIDNVSIFHSVLPGARVAAHWAAR